MAEAQVLCKMFEHVVNSELSGAWGPPGKPGDEANICAACENLRIVALQSLEWEEKVRFSGLPKGFEKIPRLLCGIMGRLLDETARMLGELESILCRDNPSGHYNIKLVVSIPEHWAEDFN